jgi:hypothetical protein
MNTVDAIQGRYEGTGHWYDSGGKTMAYRVSQRNAAGGDGFTMEFKHEFDDGTVTDAKFAMRWIAPFLFRLSVADSELGNGYCIADSCHYYLKVGGKFVEVSYRPTADGLEVHGSSTENAEGNYIAWRETLRRID